MVVITLGVAGMAADTGVLAGMAMVIGAVAIGVTQDHVMLLRDHPIETITMSVLHLPVPELQELMIVPVLPGIPGDVLRPFPMAGLAAVGQGILTVLSHVVPLMIEQAAERELQMVSLQEADIPMVAEHGAQTEQMEHTQACGVPVVLPEHGLAQVKFPVQ